MKIKTLSIVVLFMICAVPEAATAMEGNAEGFTLVRVIEFAAIHAPEVRLATTRYAEGEARLAAAQVRTLENPKLDLTAGPRQGTENSVDVEVGLEIPLELGRRRDKRVALARAGMEREKHTIGDVRRLAIAAAVGAYYRVLQAEAGLRLARDRKTLAEELLRIARERHLAGDAAKFEVNLTQTEVSRAESDIAAAQGRTASVRTGLARTLGLSSGAELRIVGDIRERSFFDTLRSGPAPAERADIQAAEADVEASRAALSLAEAERMPDLAFRLSYKREADENIALGGIAISLPFLNPRPGLVQEARMQKQRAQITAELRRAAMSAEIEGARQAYDAAIEAVRWIEAEGLPRQQENEALASEGYRAGKINLTTLLQVRREALEMGRNYLERLGEAAVAGIELVSASGTWSGAK